MGLNLLSKGGWNLAHEWTPYWAKAMNCMGRTSLRVAADDTKLKRNFDVCILNINKLLN